MRKFLLMGVLLCFWGGVATAQDAAYKEGVHYFLIDQAPAQRDAVEVTEIFSYMCNHCATFEPYMQSWKERMPENVVLKRIPVSFGRRAWEIYARSYVAATIMGIEEESHVGLMDAIWKDRRQMRSMEELAEFYSQFGVEHKAFMATAQSFAVDAQMRREQQLVSAWGVRGTPAMVVNGRYRISSNRDVPGFDAMLAVVDYLVEVELAKLTTESASE